MVLGAKRAVFISLCQQQHMPTLRREAVIKDIKGPAAKEPFRCEVIFS
jgi:hypothetical protein